MAEQIIISETDVREFYPQLSVNIAVTKVDSSILLAQQNDLEPFLGWYLYNAFIEDYNGTTFDTAIYQTLFDGESYDYRGNQRYFRGIRHLLSVYSFVRTADISDVNLTESGLVDKVTEESEIREDFQQRNSIRAIKSAAIRLEGDARAYLETKSTTYPLYTKVYSTTEFKTSYNFVKV